MIDTTYMTEDEIYNLQVKRPCNSCKKETPECVLDDSYGLCQECFHEYTQLNQFYRNLINPK